jgi:hypothetical protein
MLPPNLTVWWVPDPPGIVNVDAPKVAEINAGYNLSCAMTAAYTLGWTDRDTDATEGLCDDSNVKNPIRKNYDGKLTFFLDSTLGDKTIQPWWPIIPQSPYPPAPPASPRNTLYNWAFLLFRNPVNVSTNSLHAGYLVQRIGKSPKGTTTPTDYTTAAPAAVGDYVTVFRFYAGDPSVKVDAKAPLQMEVSFYAQGLSSNGLVQVVANS